MTYDLFSVSCSKNRRQIKKCDSSEWVVYAINKIVFSNDENLGMNQLLAQSNLSKILSN